MTTSVSLVPAQVRLGNLTVIDVRSPEEYASGHLSGAVNVPLDHSIDPVTLVSDTNAWAADAHEPNRPPGTSRQVWAMERQVDSPPAPSS
ncbi:rhodanese-like domain-containing protein [Streptomyces sp. KR55]|uniref:rhodanese-like domain-containing protein n=1 Tax=Streptomyces sp. KR55 TaxID=3457425 RepID=UPI003FD21962